MCGDKERKYGEAKHDVLGLSERQSRTKWQVEHSESNFYFEQPGHGTDLRMCVYEEWCDGTVHVVLGFSEKLSRTKCQVKQSRSNFYPKLIMECVAMKPGAKDKNTVCLDFLASETK